MAGGIALDLSSHTGFAFGNFQNARPTTGVWDLPRIDDRASMDFAWAKMFLHLEETHQSQRFEWMTIEAPLDTYRHTSGKTRKSPELALGLMGLYAAACTWGRTRLPDDFEAVMDENVQTVRKHFVGHGRPKNPKEAVVAQCRRLGWSVIDHNAGDAAALWHFEMCRRYPDWAVSHGTDLGAAANKARAA